MNTQDEIPISHQAVFRIALDVLVAGLLGGITTYAVTPNVQGATLAGIVTALKTLQSRMAPDLDTMNKQRAIQQRQDSATVQQSGTPEAGAGS